jgi:ABC-type transport system involved in multi-copper enzyme maturation permease subunit
VACALPLAAGWLWIGYIGARWLFGPVFFYDAVTMARRGRYFLVRLGYALALVLILAVTWERQPVHRMLLGSSVHFVRTGGMVVQGDAEASARIMARFAQGFFFAFMSCQFLAVFLFTPTYVAGAIADEKERRTIEFLLTTDLHTREIVFGKLAARLGNLALLVLTGLPILSLSELWGGVDPELVVAGFIATAMTILSVAGLSLVNSVYAQRSRDAVLVTYLAIGAYFAVWFFGSFTGLASTAGATPFAPPVVSPPSTTRTPLEWLIKGGNILALHDTLDTALSNALPLSSVLPSAMRDYIIFHGALACICIAWAALRMRALALRQKHQARRRRADRWKPKIGRQPMLWKELFVERGLGFNRFGRLLVVLMILVSILPAVWLLVGLYGDIALVYGRRSYAWQGLGRSHAWERLGPAINTWVRIVSALMAGLTLIAVAMRASTSVSGERDRQTFDSLACSPLRPQTILFAKLIGSLTSVRWAVAWLLLVWTLGLWAGGLDVVAFPWLILVWLVYGVFLAMLGLWCSTRSRTSLRATLLTLALAIGLMVGHYAVWIFIPRPHVYNVNFVSWPNSWQNTVWQIEAYGFTPPLAIAWLSFGANQYVLSYFSESWEDPWYQFRAIAIGTLFWALAAGVLWRLTVVRLARLSNR